MIGMIINDKKNNIYSQVYLNGNKIGGYSFIKDNILTLNKDYIDSIINSIRLNNNCKYMTKYEDYDFYYDEENGLKHFIKDGIENVDLFVKYNTTDGILYNAPYDEKNEKNNQNNKAFKLKIKQITISVTKGMIIGLLLGNIINGVLWETNIKKENLFFENISYYDLVKANFTHLSSLEIEQLIYNSNGLTTGQKQLLCNIDLLDDVIPYYDGEYMEYVIKERTKNLTINYTNENSFNAVDEFGNIINGTFAGCYNALNPNIIAISEKCKSSENQIIPHEFIHLLQQNCKYSCIYEPSADLISSEYMGKNINHDSNDIKSLRLLMDVIGSKVIWEYNFKNEEPLDKIFRENLSEEEYQELDNLLSTYTNALTKEGWDKVNSMYYKIAKKIMNEEEYNEFIVMHSDNVSNITNDIDGITKYYFNGRKMVNEESFEYENHTYIGHQIVSKEEYLILKNIGKDVISKIIIGNGVTINSSGVIIPGNKAISIEEAIDLGYAKREYILNTKMSQSEYDSIEEDKKNNMWFEIESNIEKNFIKSFKNDPRYQINEEIVKNYK